MFSLGRISSLYFYETSVSYVPFTPLPSERVSHSAILPDIQTGDPLQCKRQRPRALDVLDVNTRTFGIKQYSLSTLITNISCNVFLEWVRFHLLNRINQNTSFKFHKQFLKYCFIFVLIYLEKYIRTNWLCLLTHLLFRTVYGKLHKSIKRGQSLLFLIVQFLT